MAIKSSNQITFTEQKKIVEIEEWYLATNYDSGVTIENGDWGTWTKEVQVIGESKKYLWNYEKIIYSLGDPEISEPMVIGFYGKGNDGRSIENIKNYYQTTTNTNPPTSWLESVPMLDPINKYLWNYEVIIYTDGTTTETDPAIIGAYGDSGTDAVDFQIYSVDGFEFNDNLSSIELKTVAYQGGSPIESGVAYQWKWWNSASTLDGRYEDIPDATSSTLIVTNTDIYAFTSLKCEMTYDNITYEDYVTLTKKATIYTSAIKFFDGSNIFNQDKPYLVSYIELYKSNQIEETIKTNKYYGGNNFIDDSGIIQTDVEGTFENNELAYFVYKNTNNKYSIVLGQYTDGSWMVREDNNKYLYINDIYNDTTSNVIVISKEDVSRSREFNIQVYQNRQDSSGNIIYDDTTFVSRTNAIITDLNDPIVSDTAPQNAKLGQLWLDTSSEPYILKIYIEEKWEYFSNQNGGSVYTSQPSQYSVGDLWILADTETCKNFGSGTILKAIRSSTVFSEDDWTDAMEEVTTIITNIKESFYWDDAGIKVMRRVTDSNGNITNPFYVSIDSTRMGFHSVEYKNGAIQNDVEVVHVGNNSATIQNATFQGESGTTFENNATFNRQVTIRGTSDFVWKIESNGSLSLAIGGV